MINYHSMGKTLDDIATDRKSRHLGFVIQARCTSMGAFSIENVTDAASWLQCEDSG